jgi:DNA-binding MarR family transcriptional regulator
MDEPARPFMPPDPKGEFRYDVPIYLLNLMVAVGRVRDAELEKALRPIGLNVTRYRTMAVIWRLGECTMSELAIISSSDRTSLTRTVDQLVAASCVERGSGAADRRKVTLSITRTGRHALRDAGQIVEACNGNVLVGVPEDLQRSLVRGLEMMLGNLGQTVELMEKVLAPREVATD